jgi:hypothetical protein
LKDQACAELARQVGAVLESEVGQSLYDPSCDFPNPVLGAASAGTIDAPTLPLELVGTRLVFGFKTTQPTPLGSWADPRFTTTFDATVAGTIRLPRALPGAAITLDALSIQVSNAQITGDNVTGAVEAFATQVYAALEPSRLAVLHAQGMRVGLPQLEDPLNQALTSLASFLQRWATNGWHTAAYEVDPNGDFVLRID